MLILWYFVSPTNCNAMRKGEFYFYKWNWFNAEYYKESKSNFTLKWSGHRSKFTPIRRRFVRKDQLMVPDLSAEQSISQCPSWSQKMRLFVFCFKESRFMLEIKKNVITVLLELERGSNFWAVSLTGWFKALWASRQSFEPQASLLILLNIIVLR